MSKVKNSLLISKQNERVSKLLEEFQHFAKLGGWELNVASGEIFWTDEVYYLHDTTPEEFDPTEAYISFFLPESREIVSAALNEAIKNGKNYDLELQMLTTKGRKIDVRTTCQVTQLNGKTIRLFGICQDITDRKQIENKLKESEERLAFAMMGTQDGLWDWSLLTDKVYFSPRWKNMLGYEENEIENIFSEWKRLVHPDDLDSASSNIKYFLNNKALNYKAEFRMQHKAGHYLNILSRAFVVEGPDGRVTRLVGTHVDVTEQKIADAKLSYQSTHDGLTGLINRIEFECRMEQLLTDAKENNQTHALCYVDLDQFKVVNDTCGHIAGDEMLRQLSNVLQKVVRKGDTLGRLGGDEFGILLKQCSLDDTHRLTNAILTEIAKYAFVFEGHSFRSCASIGLVPIIATTLNSIELLKYADAACYMAKNSGRNRIHVLSGRDEDLVKWQGEILWVNRIQQALDENRFCLYAQSIMPLNNSKELHYELLIRMIDEEGNLIPPNLFLPAAERYNLMSKLDQWVIESAFKALAKNSHFQPKLSFISINLSGQSIGDEHFLDFVVQKLDEYKIEGRHICFEITETTTISNILKADKFICKLKQFGCRFALDDFGSGFSSFGYLKTLPVDFLKIDGMFVKDMVKDPIDRAMVKSINDIGHVMGMQTIAEFVDNDEIKVMLREMNVDFAQGYCIHAPQPFDELVI